MRIKWPSIQFFLKAVLISIGFGVVGFIIFPLVSGPDRWVFIVGLFIASFAGSILSVIQAEARPPKERTEQEVKSIFVGNLAFKASKEELRNLFSQYGYVHAVRIMTDRATRRPRGFAFVEMNARDADAAIRELNNVEFCGRNIKVKAGKDREQLSAE